MKVSENLMTDKQYDGLLIEFLDDLETQLEKAIAEKASGAGIYFSINASGGLRISRDK